MQFTKIGHLRFTTRINYTTYIIDGFDKKVGWKILVEKSDGTKLTTDWIDTRSTKAFAIGAVRDFSTSPESIYS